MYNPTPKISVNVLGYKHREHLKECFDNLLAQNYPNLEITFIDNNSGDGSEEFIRQNYPQVKVIQTGANTGYSGGHNIGIKNTEGEFVSFVNPDIKMKSDFYSQAIKPLLENLKIAAVQGKLIRPEPVNGKYLLDSAGVVLTRTRRAYDRGQWEQDLGQYEKPQEVFGINGACPLWRRSALQDIAINGEILDEDLFAYFDDVDLSWRARRKGWILWYEPKAIAYHERAMGKSPKEITEDPLVYKKFRGNFSQFTRRLSWKNHILLILKNDSGWPFWRDLPLIVARQIGKLGYILLFERDTLGAFPTLCRQIPKILQKRKFINNSGKVSPNVIGKWFK